MPMYSQRKRCRYGRKPDQAGFTLMEVTIALAIFSVGIAAVLSMQLQAMDGTRTSRSSLEAGNLAQDRIERLLALDITDPQLAGGTIGADPSPPAGYTINWSIVDNGETPNSSRTITVTAAHADGRRSATLVVIKGGRT